MTPLKSPKSLPTLVGFDLIEVTENYRGKYCNATVEKVYSDGSRVSTSFTLWMDKPAQGVEDADDYIPADLAYTANVAWTDATVKAQIDKILSQ